MGVFVDDFGRMDADRSKRQFQVFEVSKSGDVMTSKKGIGYTICSIWYINCTFFIRAVLFF